MTQMNHLNNVKARWSWRKKIYICNPRNGTWFVGQIKKKCPKITSKIDPWFSGAHLTRLNVMFSKSGREGKQTMWREEKRGRGEVWGPHEQVAEASRCCREAVRQIMSCLDYLQGLITVEHSHLGQLQASSAGISCPHCHPYSLRSHLSRDTEVWKHLYVWGKWKMLIFKNASYPPIHLGKMLDCYSCFFFFFLFLSQECSQQTLQPHLWYYYKDYSLNTCATECTSHITVTCSKFSCSKCHKLS